MTACRNPRVLARPLTLLSHPAPFLKIYSLYAENFETTMAKVGCSTAALREDSSACRVRRMRR